MHMHKGPAYEYFLVFKQEFTHHKTHCSSSKSLVFHVAHAPLAVVNFYALFWLFYDYLSEKRYLGKVREKA